MPHPCRQCTHCDERETSEVSNEVTVRAVVRFIVDELMDNQPERVIKTPISTDVESDSAGKEKALAQQEDPEIGPIVRLRLERADRPSINELQSASETTKILWSHWHRLVAKDGVVYKLWFSQGGEPNRLLLLAPRVLRDDIIRKSHGGMSVGHMGIAKTCDQVQRRAF